MLEFRKILESDFPPTLDLLKYKNLKIRTKKKKKGYIFLVYALTLINQVQKNMYRN